MAKKIYGDLSATGNIQINGSNTMRDVNGIQADVSGNIVIPNYTKSYIDKFISMMPISRVGSMDYLPMNISGSFEGSSNYIGKGVYPVLIESDGTLVYLRAGTNGSTFGYYYCYTKNARTIADMTPVLTTEKFTPTSFTSNHTLTAFVGSNAAEVLMMRTNNGTANTYTIALTNGTMNKISHQNTEFLATAISGTDPQYAMVHNNLVYIFCLDSYSNTGEMAISVYTISTADVAAGTSSSLTKVTGFSGSNLFGTAVSASANIKLAPLYFSNTPSDNSFICVPTGNVYTSFSLFWGNSEGTLHAVGEGNNIRVAYVHASEVTTQQTLVRSLSGISLVLNTTTNAYTFDNTNLGQVTATTNSTTGAITWNNPYAQDMTNYSGLSLGSSLNRVPTYMNTNDGVQFCTICRHDTFPEHYVTRAKVTNFTSLYNSWNVTTRALNSQYIQSISPVFGSVIGENLIRPTIVSATKIMMHCSGTYNGQPTDINTTAYTTLSGTPTGYTYNSVSTGGTINGYTPSAARGILDASDGRYLGCVTVMNQDASTEVYASSFMEGYATKVSALAMNQTDFTFAQTITIGSTVLSTLKAAMIASVTLPYAVSNSYCVLYYVPDTTYTKSFAVTTVLVAAPTGTVNTYLILSEVDVTFASNVVTAATVSTSRVFSKNIAASSISTNLIQRTGGLIIAKYADFTFIGIPGVYSINTSAGNFTSIICKVDNSTKLITGTPIITQSGYNSSSGGAYEAGVIPGVGFGVFQNGSITDIKTKLIFKNFGTTSAQYDTMIANVGGTPVSTFVVAAQDVAQGFIVYFTQSIPVILQGAYYDMPITSVDLNTVDASPANKTFYLYITVIEGEAVYQFSTTLLSEELYRTYIGTIVTGASGITSISTEKVTRFLTDRPSTTQRGSAIPASTGVPSGTGTRWS